MGSSERETRATSNGHSGEQCDEAAGLAGFFRQCRAMSEEICQPLAIEDYTIQTMVDVSPPKWHLAHTTWFFETFLLEVFQDGFQPFHPRFRFLFNSYYNSVGRFHPRHRRGDLSRPTVEVIYDYRRRVSGQVLETWAQLESSHQPEWLRRVELGIHHEQQHQELLLTDLKHILGSNPLFPPYRTVDEPRFEAAPAFQWCEFPGGIVEVGHDGTGFCYDNEQPRHRVFMQPFALASRPVTNGEYMEFISAGGYRRHEYWLSEGWRTVSREQWEAPLYWHNVDGDWYYYTLAGLRPVVEDEPVCHISYYEADAFARWRQARLPTEFEWEIAAAGMDVQEQGDFLDFDVLRPRCVRHHRDGLWQMFGGVWEWTQSPYSGYPGYRAAEGALGEYNGKFMSGQFVLRGGSFATPPGHMRATYRNFFYPGDRWQFSGLRLARDVA